MWETNGNYLTDKLNDLVETWTLTKNEHISKGCLDPISYFSWNDEMTEKINMLDITKPIYHLHIKNLHVLTNSLGDLEEELNDL